MAVKKKHLKREKKRRGVIGNTKTGVILGTFPGKKMREGRLASPTESDNLPQTRRKKESLKDAVPVQNTMVERDQGRRNNFSINRTTESLPLIPKTQGTRD